MKKMKNSQTKTETKNLKKAPPPTNTKFLQTLTCFLTHLISFSASAELVNFNYFQNDIITINIEKDLNVEISKEILNQVGMTNFQIGDLETMNPIIKQKRLCEEGICPQESHEYKYINRIYLTNEKKKVLIDQFYSYFFSKSSKTPDLFLGTVTVDSEKIMKLKFEKKLEILKMVEDIKPAEVSTALCPFSYPQLDGKGGAFPITICLAGKKNSDGKNTFNYYVIEGLDQNKKYKKIKGISSYEENSACEVYSRKIDYEVLVDKKKEKRSIIAFGLYQPSSHYTHYKCDLFLSMLFLRLPYKNSKLENVEGLGSMLEAKSFLDRKDQAVISIGQYVEEIDGEKVTYIYYVVRTYAAQNVVKEYYRKFKSSPKVCLTRVEYVIDPKKKNSLKCVENTLNLIKDDKGDILLCSISDSNYVIYYNGPNNNSEKHNFYICKVGRSKYQESYFIDKNNCNDIYNMEKDSIYRENFLVVSRIEEKVKHKLYVVYWRAYNPPSKTTGQTEDNLIHYITHKISFEWKLKKQKINGIEELAPDMKLVDVSFHKKFRHYYSTVGEYDFYDYILTKDEVLTNGDNYKEKAIAVYSQKEKYLGLKKAASSTKTQTIDLSFSNKLNIQIKITSSDKFYEVEVSETEKKQNSPVMKVTSNYYFHVYKYDERVKSNDLVFNLGSNKKSSKAILFNYNAHLVEFDKMFPVKIDTLTDYLTVGNYLVTHLENKNIKIYRCQNYLEEIYNDPSLEKEKKSTFENVKGFKILINCKELKTIENVKEELHILSLSDTKFSILGILRTRVTRPSGKEFFLIFRFDKQKQVTTTFELPIKKGTRYLQAEIFEENEVISLQILNEDHQIFVYRTQKQDYFDVSTMKLLNKEPLELKPKEGKYAKINTAVGHNNNGDIKTTFVGFYQFQEQSKIRIELTYGWISFMDENNSEKMKITKFNEKTMNTYLMIKPTEKSVCLSGNWFYFIEKSTLGSSNDFFGINLFDESIVTMPRLNLVFDKAYSLFCMKSFMALRVSRTKEEGHKLLFFKHGKEKLFRERLIGVADIPKSVLDQNIKFSTSSEAVFMRYKYQEGNIKKLKSRLVFINTKGTQLYLKFEKEVADNKKSIELKVGNGQVQEETFSAKFDVQKQNQEFNLLFIDGNNVIKNKKRIQISTEKKWIDIEKTFNITNSIYKVSIVKGEAEKQSQNSRLLSKLFFKITIILFQKKFSKNN